MAKAERSSVGMQLVIPGCETRTLPKSSSRANWTGQGLLGFYVEPTLKDVLVHRGNAPLKAKKGQKGLIKCGLFGGCQTFLGEP